MKQYKTVKEVFGPILFVEKIHNVAYGETAIVTLPNGEKKKAQVLESGKGYAAVQLFGNTTGLDTKNTSVAFTGETLRMALSEDMLGRTFSGAGEPLDKGAPIASKEKRDINGNPMNPRSRDELHDFIQTGVSTIDVTNTLVRGQKLPIFSAAGLPHNELAVQVARQASVKSHGKKGKDDEFAVVFAGMGITNQEAQYFIQSFEKTGALERSILFLNKANDPSIERLITPRLALTAAEYLAFEKETESDT